MLGAFWLDRLGMLDLNAVYVPDTFVLPQALGGALLLPNTLQILERYTPALTAPRPAFEIGWLRRVLVWTPSLAWAAGLGALACLAVFRLGGQSEFLYWQF